MPASRTLRSSLGCTAYSRLLSPTYLLDRTLYNEGRTMRMIRMICVVGRAGLEPAALCLKGTCSAIELTAHSTGL